MRLPPSLFFNRSTQYDSLADSTLDNFKIKCKIVTNLKKNKYKKTKLIPSLPVFVVQKDFFVAKKVKAREDCLKLVYKICDSGSTGSSDCNGQDKTDYEDASKRTCRSSSIKSPFKMSFLLFYPDFLPCLNICCLMEIGSLQTTP